MIITEGICQEVSRKMTFTPFALPFRVFLLGPSLCSMIHRFPNGYSELRSTLFSFIRTSTFAAEAEAKLDVLIFPVLSLKRSQHVV